MLGQGVDPTHVRVGAKAPLEASASMANREGSTMRKFVLPLALLATIAASSAALAATTTGKITKLDVPACSVTLKHAYHFGTKCDFSKLKVGEKVTITYSMAGKVRTATAIKPSK